MTSDVDIANRAILAVGARGQIAQIREQSNEARYVRAFYQSTLDALLRSAHWNFARKFAYLSQLKSVAAIATAAWDPATQPPPPWLYEYAYPSDCLKLRYITPRAGDGTVLPVFPRQPQRFLEAIDQHIVGGAAKVLLSNQAQAIGCYTVRVDNPDLWDAQFVVAFENALGARLCIPLSGDKKMADEARKAAAEIVLQARVSDGNEGLTFAPDTERPPDWITVRGYNATWQPGSQLLGWFDTPSFLAI